MDARDTQTHTKTPEIKLFADIPGLLSLVEVTGFEPATFWSRSAFAIMYITHDTAYILHKPMFNLIFLID